MVVAGRRLNRKIYTTWGVKLKTSFNLIVQEISIHARGDDHPLLLTIIL